jgi:pyochelin synthetase
LNADGVPGKESQMVAGHSLRPNEEDRTVSESVTSTVTSLLNDLARAEVKLRLLDGDRIEVTAASGRLTPGLRDGIVRHKPELLEFLANARRDGSAAAELPSIIPDEANLYEPFPPSDLQQSFLIGGRPGFEYYVRPHQYMEFDLDDLDPDRFADALNAVIARHRKSLVVVRDDMLLQTVHDPGPVSVAVTDLRPLPEHEQDRELDRTRARMCRQEPSYDTWPWLHPRISLYRQDKARLHYNNNNIFTDAPSGVALITDALRVYREPGLRLAEPAASYRDCVLALAELEESPRGQASKKYWCDRMADWPAAPELPLVSGTEHRGRSMLYRRELILDAPLWTAIKHQADARGLTPTNVLLGAHAEVIAYWSGSPHFLLNNMISHRPVPLHPDMGDVLGNFASLYPLEVDWRHNEPFHERLRRLQARVMADVAHSYWSGAKVLQTLNQVRRTPGRASCPFAVGSALFVGPADRPSYSMLETPQTLLDTEFWELRDGRLMVIWDVIEAMFPDGLIDAMLAGYRSVLTELAGTAEAWERTAFDLLPAAQRERRADLNQPADEIPGLLHDPLPLRAGPLADKPAVVTATSTVTYAELHRRSTRVAELLRANAVAPGDLVAVVLPKGAEQSVAVHGALTAGGAYVPIDPLWPQDRIRYLLKETAVTAVLSHSALADELSALCDVPIIAVDAPEAMTPTGDEAPTRRNPDELAYVIFTSGSTGRPKGAMLDHRGPVNTIADINSRFGVGPDDVVFGVSSLCFDLSVYDVFGTIAAGATLVTPTDAEPDPASWLDLVSSHGVTVWNSVPAIMQLFAEAAATAGVRLPALKTVLLSGDWIPVHLPERIREIAPNARVISLGGATEASIWSICFPIDQVDPAWPSIPYGKPMTNQTWYVLDENNRDAPDWVPGQLYIGGTGVALGYLHDQDRTTAAFVRHPHSGERLYRTGDLGRYLPGGDIEFLGRSDFQVKIQGFRVEPGEIEHALLEHPAVEQASVVARRSGSGQQLAAFVVGERPNPVGLRDFLAGLLPGYLVPSRVTVLDNLPLTPNGKVDRKALESLDTAPTDERPGSYTGPGTPTEKVLVDIWESILDTAPIGVHDDFFERGGQSFAALRVCGLITDRLGRQVPLGVMLERPTIAGLAGYLDAAETAWSPLIRLRATADDRPWFLVHPAGGNVVCYRALAEAMDKGCYAFQAPGPACGRPPLAKVEDMAEEYLRALLDVQPHGPYLLGGWSSGAIVAVELARRLEERGEWVERLAVIDAPAPVTQRDIDAGQLVLWFLEDLATGFDPDAVAAETTKQLAELGPLERLARALPLLQEQGVADTGLGSTDLAAAFAVFEGMVTACNSYHGTAIDAPITVIRAQRSVVSEFRDHPYADAPDWGWSALTTGQVNDIPLSGTHHTLLTDRRTVAAIAAALRRKPQ